MASRRQTYKQRLHGKRVLPPDAFLFLLDESLGSPVAKALALVQYPFVTVEAVMGQQGVPDPEIIRWCATNNAMWVHADDQARRQHKVALRASGIYTLLLHRQKGGMTSKEQLRILSFVLPHLIQARQRKPSVRHYRASAPTELAKPALKSITV